MAQPGEFIRRSVREVDGRPRVIVARRARRAPDRAPRVRPDRLRILVTPKSAGDAMARRDAGAAVRPMPAAGHDVSLQRFRKRLLGFVRRGGSQSHVFAVELRSDLGGLVVTCTPAFDRRLTEGFAEANVMEAVE